MACEPLPGCEDCTGASEPITCEKARELRCRFLAQLEVLACSPWAPTEIEGVRFESKSAAMEALTKMIQWTFEVCSMSEGSAIEYSSAAQCNSGLCRSNWYGSCRE